MKRGLGNVNADMGPMYVGDHAHYYKWQIGPERIGARRRNVPRCCRPADSMRQPWRRC